MIQKKLFRSLPKKMGSVKLLSLIRIAPINYINDGYSKFVITFMCIITIAIFILFSFILCVILFLTTSAQFCTAVAGYGFPGTIPSRFNLGKDLWIGTSLGILDAPEWNPLLLQSITKDSVAYLMAFSLEVYHNQQRTRPLLRNNLLFSQPPIVHSASRQFSATSRARQPLTVIRLHNHHQSPILQL